jgi:hypothetical protein
LNLERFGMAGSSEKSISNSLKGFSEGDGNMETAPGGSFHSSHSRDENSFCETESARQLHPRPFLSHSSRLMMTSAERDIGKKEHPHLRYQTWKSQDMNPHATAQLDASGAVQQKIKELRLKMLRSSPALHHPKHPMHFHPHLTALVSSSS